MPIRARTDGQQPWRGMPAGGSGMLPAGYYSGGGFVDPNMVPQGGMPGGNMAAPAPPTAPQPTKEQRRKMTRKTAQKTALGGGGIKPTGVVPRFTGPQDTAVGGPTRPTGMVPPFNPTGPNMEVDTTGAMGGIRRPIPPTIPGQTPPPPVQITPTATTPMAAWRRR